MMNPEIRLGGALLGAVLLSLSLLGAPGEQPVESGLSPEQTAEPQEQLHAGPLASINEREPVPLARSQGPTGEQSAETLAFLENYWGDDWPAMRQELIQRGRELDKLPVIAPWEEAFPDLEKFFDPLGEERIESAFTLEMAWPAWEYNFGGEERVTRGRPGASLARILFSLTRNPGAFELSGAAEARIDAALAPINREIEVAALEFLGHVTPLMQSKLHTGDYQRAPLDLPRDQPHYTSGEVLYGGAVGIHGWSVAIAILRSEAPEIASLSDRLDALRDQRKAQARALVRDELASNS